MNIKTLLAGIAASALPLAAAAENFSNTTLELVHTWRAEPDAGFGTGTRDGRLQSFRLLHFGTFDYGDNCFFVDNYRGKDVGVKGVENQQYMAYMPRLSLGKLLGKNLSAGFIKDVLLGARVEYASYGNFHASGFGPSLDLDVPGFDWMQLRLFMQDTNYDKRAFYVHNAWAARFALLGLNWHFDGYFWTRKQDDGSRKWYAEPDLTVDLVPSGKAQAGVRLTYAGYKAYSRATPQVIVKWTF